MVVGDGVESFTKTKQAVQFLKAVNAYDDVQKVIDSKNLRAGVGKMRNRRHTQRRGPLVVYGEDKGLVKAFRNLPGVELLPVASLNFLKLAPGGHLGRFIIWTKSAFEALDSVFGTYKTGSTLKKGYFLPQPIISNPDISRIINSDEIQSVVRPAKEGPKRASLKKNPLRNVEAMLQLNPYAQAVRRAEQLAKEERAKSKDAKVKKARKHVDNAAFVKVMLTE